MALTGDSQCIIFHYEQEALFWDSHSLAEFEDELEVVEVQVERPLQHILGVRLDAPTIGKARRQRSDDLPKALTSLPGQNPPVLYYRWANLDPTQVMQAHRCREPATRQND